MKTVTKTEEVKKLINKILPFSVAESHHASWLPMKTNKKFLNETKNHVCFKQIENINKLDLEIRD